MVEQRPLDGITGAASTDPCCLPGFCAYQPASIGFYRDLRSWCRQSGQDPVEGAYSFVHAGSDHQAAIVASAHGCGGETAQQRWADRIADVERAERAGCRTDEQIARYLCPFSLSEQSC